MNRLMFVVCAVLVPLSVFGSVKPPAVSCSLSWDLRDKDVATVKLDNAKPVAVTVHKEGTSSLRGFALTANLRGAGPAGGSVMWHDLSISIRHDDHEAYRSESTQGSHRHALILIAGNERVVALCDITHP